MVSKRRRQAHYWCRQQTGIVSFLLAKSLYAIARPSVCRLSVCNVRAPYSGGSNFRQYFDGIRYLGHPLTSVPGLFVPKTFRSQERKVPMENFRSPGTKVPGNFRSRALSFSGTFVPGDRKFLGTLFLVPFIPGNFRSHYPIRLVAALRCVLNYCMFGCDFTLMMLTPLWTSQLTLYVGRPAFTARLFVFVCQLASSHLFTLHSYLTEKNNTNTP